MHNLLAQNVKLNDIIGSNPGPSGLEQAFKGTLTIGRIVSRLVQFVFIFAGIGLLLMLIAGGFDFLTSGGDTKKLDQGKQRITNAIVGFLLIFVAFWLTQIIGRMFGLDAITNVFQ